jgi:hypothetical protein
MHLDRRQLLQRLSLLMGAALSAPVASGLLAGCRPRPAGAPGRVLDHDRLRTAGQLAERILPRTDTPGALDAGVDRFLDAMLAEYVPPGDRERYLAGLDRLERRARERWGAGFADCALAEQDALVAELDRAVFGDESPAAELDEADRRFYRLHKELTVAGYYTSELGQTRELRLMPLGEYRADEPIGPDARSWA